MNTNIQRRIINISAHGYNDCFCIADKTKQVKYVNEYGELRRAHKKDDNYYHRYHLYYEEAKDIAEYYNHEQGEEILSVSIQLENAKYNDLYLFVIDFDKPKDENGVKQPIDTEAPFFKAAYKAADIVTRSKNGGYHMYFAINKEKSQPLFEEINLLCEGNSYVSKTGTLTSDGRIKVDFFCDTLRLMYEPLGWDINKGLTDKTQELYELIKEHFSFAQQPMVEKHKIKSKAPKRKREYREHTDIPVLSESDLTAQMDEKQRSVFLDLMANKSPNCSRTQWYRTGIDIYCVYGAELGGAVFYFWSKDYPDFDYSAMLTEWDAIVSKEDAELRDNKWIDILNGDIDIKSPLTWNELCGDAPEQTTFRGKLINWIHESAAQDNIINEQDTDEKKHWIQWGKDKYRRDAFFKAAYGADYKKFTEKVVFKGKLSDNTLWLSTGARTALEYDLLRYRHKDNLSPISNNIDLSELAAFFSSDKYSFSQDTKRRLYRDGLPAIVTFGVGRQQKGAAQHTWCYTKKQIIEYINEKEIAIGVKYSGIKDNWNEWAANIKAAYEHFMKDISDGELWDNILPALYTRLPQHSEYERVEVHRMTYTQSDYEKVSQWVLGGCKDDFPLHGTTPDSDFEFTIMFDTDEVEYIDSRKALKERNTAQKEELAQARAAAKIDKDRAAIMAHLSDEKQEFTREDLNKWGFSNNVITRLKKSTIKKVRVKIYVLQET